MKPHLRKVRGVWVCRMAQKAIMVRSDHPLWVFLPYGAQVGHGYTVRQAYEDWCIQMEAQKA